MPYKKGESGNPSGRRKGSKNKFTTLKDAFLQVFFDEDGIGGVEGVKELLRNSPRNQMAFIQIIAKMLPSNLGIEPSEEFGVILKKILTDERPKEE